jgi:hypothetical protein
MTETPGDPVRSLAGRDILSALFPTEGYMIQLKRVCAAMAAAWLTMGTVSFAASPIPRANSGVAAGARSLASPVVDPACKPVFDANDKTLDTPNHLYQEQSDAHGKKNTGELITVNGERYVLVSGKWSKSRMTVAETKAQSEENKKNAKVVTCKRIGSDSVNGQTATVYSEHTETEESKSDGKIWVSSSGVILKSEIDLDSGGDDKTHMSIRYEYGNVKAPI